MYENAGQFNLSSKAVDVAGYADVRAADQGVLPTPGWKFGSVDTGGQA